MSERMSVEDARVALDYTYEAAAVESYFDVDRYCDARNAYRDALLAARDAEWRAAVERVRPQQPIGAGIDSGPSLYVLDFNAKLDALLAAMEVPHDGQ